MLQFLNASQIDKHDLDRAAIIAESKPASLQKTIVKSLKAMVDKLGQGNQVTKNQISSFLTQLNQFILSQGHDDPHFFQTSRQDDPHALFSKIREVFDFFLTDLSFIEVNETDERPLVIPSNSLQNYDSLEAIDANYRQARQDILDGVGLDRYDDWRAFQMKNYLEKANGDSNEPTWKLLGYIKYSTYKGESHIPKICYTKRIELSAANRKTNTDSLDLDQMIRSQKLSFELDFSETIRMDILRYNVTTTPGQYRIDGKNNSKIDFVQGAPGVISLNGAHFRITSATIHSPGSTRDGGHWTALRWDPELQQYVHYSDSSQPRILDLTEISVLSKGFVSLELKST